MKRAIPVGIALVLVVGVLSATGLKEYKSDSGEFGLTILHSNDGESSLTANDYSGSVAQFAQKLQTLRAASPYPVITVSAGDNFLTGLQYSASQGVYDARALNLAGYDFSAVGNHEFDLGVDGFRRFLAEADFKFISSNLDFSDEPDVLQYVGDKVVPWYIKEITTPSGTQKVGFIGATTESISVISSPGRVKIADVEESLQQAADDLRKQGVNIIISLSHLQNVDEEIELASKIDGVDIFVAGGGDNLLGNPNNDYLMRVNNDGDRVPDSPEGPYPYRTQSPSGEPVLVVATDGSYNYIGQLMVTFNKKGIITSVNPQSGPVGVHPDDPTNSTIDREIVQTVSDAIAGYKDEIIGSTSVALDGTRQLVRTQETAFGNLIADSYLAAANELYDRDVHFAVTNGGGIRKSIVIPANSDISMYHILTALPFSNYLTAIEDMAAQEIKALFEHSVAGLPDASGRFLQVSGVSVTYDASRDPGDRVRSIRIGRTPIVENGEIVDLENTYTFVTNSFLAGGGDGYAMLDTHPSILKVQLGVSYAEATYNYIAELKNVNSRAWRSPRLIEQ